MTPLSVIKFIVEHLQGTGYEPWVNALLYMLLAVAVFSAISYLVGKGVQKHVVLWIVAVVEKIKNRRGYAPEWESFRLKVEPYTELISSVYFAIIGLYSALLVFCAVVGSISKAPLWALCIGVVWIFASLIYVRVNLESASWGYHKIKNRNRR